MTDLDARPVAVVRIVGPSGTVYTHAVGWRTSPAQTDEQRERAKARAAAKRARKNARRLALRHAERLRTIDRAAEAGHVVAVWDVYPRVSQ